MSRIFHRAAAIIAGMTLPLSVWALVSPTSIDDEYGEVLEDTTVVAEISIASFELPSSMEVERNVARADRPDNLDGEAVKPEASVTDCCVWVYFLGRWYCFPCV